MMKIIPVIVFFALAASLPAAPTAPEPHGAYTGDGTVRLSWYSPPLRNPERIRYFRIYRSESAENRGTRIAELPVSLSRKQSYSDRLPEKHRVFYSLTAVNADGQESERSLPFAAALLPDLGIRDGERVSLNPDLATGKMYPVAGETVEFSATIRNRGAVTSRPCRLEIRFENGTEPATVRLPALKPGASHTVSWNYRPECRGEYHMDLSIDPDRINDDFNWSDNRLKIKCGAVERDVHFIWYGDVTKLPFANYGQCLPHSVDEWHRRGGRALSGVGATGDKLDRLYADRTRSAAYDGICIDEIYRWEKAAQNVAAFLPAYRKTFPDRMVAVWTIGEETAPQIAELVKNGTVSLLMFEVYVKPGEKIAPILRTIGHARAAGIADRILIGLVTHKDWNNWVGPEEQAASVIAQMRLIREKAPEIPGFAFWSDDAQPGVAEAVDAECYRLFVQPENKEK